MEVIGELVDALTLLPCTADREGRNDLIDLVNFELRDPAAHLDPKRGDNRRRDLVQIVMAALNQPRALAALAQAVQLVDPPSLTAGFVALTRQITQAEPVLLDIGEMAALIDLLHAVTPTRPLAELAGEALRPMPATGVPTATLSGVVLTLERRTSPQALFRFLELVAGCAAQADSSDAVREWIDQHLDRLPPHEQADLRRFRKEATDRGTRPAGRPCLQIRIEPVDEDRFSVSAWLTVSADLPPVVCGPPGDVSRAEAHAWLGRLIEERRTTEFDPLRRARIEVFLPTSHLDEAVDGWPVGGNGSQDRIGAHYSLVVRPGERTPESAERLARRWAITAQGIAASSRAAEAVEWLSTISPDGLHSLVDSDQPWAVLAFTCPLHTTEAGLHAIVESGAPVVMWVRGGHQPADRHQILTQVVQPRDISELPDAVRAFRRFGRDKPGDIRSDLALFWDDPTNPPPDLRVLRGPYPQGVS